MRLNRVRQELEHGSALPGVGGDGGPNTLAPAAAGFTPRPLGDTPVDYHKADRLLGQIVGQLDARRDDETEVCLAMLAGMCGQILSIITLGCLCSRS